MNESDGDCVGCEVVGRKEGNPIVEGDDVDGETVPEVGKLVRGIDGVSVGNGDMLSGRVGEIVSEVIGVCVGDVVGPLGADDFEGALVIVGD